MFVLVLSDMWHPYNFIFAPLMIFALVIIIYWFVKYRSSRQYALLCTGILALFEFLLSYPSWGEGVFIGFTTLTCVGVMAVSHYTETSRSRIIAGLFFVILGCSELILPVVFLLGTGQYLMPLPGVFVSLFLALTTLAGGTLILMPAFEKRSAS